MTLERTLAHRRGLRSVVLFAAAVVAGVFGLSACSHSSSASSSSTQAFLQQVHSQAPDIGNYRTNSQLAKLGQAVCNQFSAKATVAQVADRIAGQGSAGAMPTEDLGAVINASAQSLCPQYASVLDRSSGS